MVTKLFARPNKVRQVRLNVKSMLIIFFYSESIAHQEFVPAGLTVKRCYYCEVLQCLRKEVHQKCPQ
jgi:hypothetical protein